MNNVGAALIGASLAASLIFAWQRVAKPDPPLPPTTIAECVLLEMKDRAQALLPVAMTACRDRIKQQVEDDYMPDEKEGEAQ